MSEAASWWALSLGLGCCCALLAWPQRRQSFFGRNTLLLRYCPPPVAQVLAVALVPLVLAAAALGLSQWLSGQSLTAWLATLAFWSKPISVALSLQALGLLLHRRMYGAPLLLLPAALSLQLWLYYQALGIDFSRLGMIYAAALLLALPGLIFALARIDPARRLPAARFLACLLLILQWLHATDTSWAGYFQGYEWITLASAVQAPSILLTLIVAGYCYSYLWQNLRNRRMGKRP